MNFDWQPLVIVLDPAVPDWESRLSAALAKHVYANKKNAVSFFDGAVGRFVSGNLDPIRHWRDLIPPNHYENVYRDSYVDIKALLLELPSDCQAWLSCNLHVMADALTRCRGLNYLAERVRPDIVILSYGSELTYGFTNLYRAYSIKSRLLGGGRKAFRIRRWINNIWRALVGDSAIVRRTDELPSGVLMVVEDGASGVHLEPAIAIADELVRLNFAPRILTSSPEIASIVSGRGHMVFEIQPASLIGIACKLIIGSPVPWYRLRRSLRVATFSTEVVGTCFMSWLNGVLISFIAKRVIVINELNRMKSQRSVEVVITLGETFPLVIEALNWAKNLRIPNAGYTPVLIGARPDNEDFPASLHLLYGEQGAECMVNKNIDRKLIKVVGSPTFEKSLGRNREVDSSLIHQLLPRWQKGCRLVVVATEALPDPARELVPTLRALEGLRLVHVVVKIHPVDSQSTIEKIVRDLNLSNCVDILRACDLQALLHSADLLICNYSNIAVSAAMLGTPTMVPAFSCRNRPVDFIAEGFASACEDVSRLATQIEELTMQSGARKAALDNMRKSLYRFAGMADGNSQARISKIVIQLAQLNLNN